MRVGFQVLYVLVVVACFGMLSGSASAEVVAGTVVSVSPTSNRLVIKLRSKETNQALRLSSETRILIDGKTGYVNRLKPGQVVYAFVSGSTVTRLNVKSIGDVTDDSATPADTGKPAKPSKPETTPSNEPTDTRTASTTTTPVRPSTRPSRTRKPATDPVASANVIQSSGGDWNQYRGPNRDNLSSETGLLSSWPDEGPAQTWVARGIGEGYSAVSISNGRIYTMGNVGRDENVICLDLATGREVWSVTNGQAYREGQGNGPRGTPSIVDGKVYSLGANGDLSCLDAQTGQANWRKNILREFGGSNITWGISESVLIDGDRLICTPGGQRATMVALNKNTGNVIWTAAVPTSPRAAYASAIAVEVGGVRQYVNYTHGGVVGVRASDGQVMWGQRESTNGTANCSSPVFFDNQIFTASGYGTGGALFRLSSRGGQTVSQVAYETKDMKNHHGGMVVLDGYLYGSNDPGVLTCINLRNSQVVWQNRSVGKGAVAYADGHLYVRSEGGPVALVEASPSGYVEKGRFDQPQRSGRPSWSHPVIANGKLFLRDMDNLLAYDIRSQ
ncbi:MAG: PQQ-binding-like beta-propeller repeat protein [Planctomycetota bacterium]|nr:PQQ-binding-like beta-propeller repeat protein [Planctomycetota bacterium]